MDMESTGILLELLNEPMTNTIIHLNGTCAGISEEITCALEVYECHCILSGKHVLEQSLTTTELSYAMEGTIGTFIEKIISLIRTLIQKFKEIGGMILKHIESFINRFKKARINYDIDVDKINPIPFTNGFTINFSKGMSRYESFIDGFCDCSKFLDELFTELIYITTKDKQSIQKFLTDNKSRFDMLGTIDNTFFNEFVKCDIKLTADLDKWIYDIFEYQEHGESYIPTKDQIKDWSNAMNKESDCLENIEKSTQKGVNQGTNVLKDIEKKLEKSSKTIEPKYMAKYIHNISQGVNTCSQIGLHIMTSVNKFVTSKWAMLAQYISLVNNQ